ncbi:hypothetical protein ACIQNG_36795 [Streptomyces sp. NPDC091377]|uniref:hypothetical protein n=1 Tax=Streptomyces sp. NPDC091377 TaxID=3365995 RepID=UPI003815A57E
MNLAWEWAIETVLDAVKADDMVGGGEPDNGPSAQGWPGWKTMTSRSSPICS